MLSSSLWLKIAESTSNGIHQDGIALKHGISANYSILTMVQMRTLHFHSLQIFHSASRAMRSSPLETGLPYIMQFHFSQLHKSHLALKLHAGRTWGTRMPNCLAWSRCQYRRWVVLMRRVCCLCPFFDFFPLPGMPSAPFAGSLLIG